MTFVRTYLIPIQSYGDLITNSSSETYVVETNKPAYKVKQILDEVHAEHEEDEWMPGECAEVEVYSFEDYFQRNYEEEYDRDYEEYKAMLVEEWDVPIPVLQQCLFVRVDYGYQHCDKFLTENFKCIASDHILNERRQLIDGKIVKNYN